MVQFYRTYCDNVIVAPLVRQISWTNNLVILSKTKSSDEREFYIRLCLKNHYSKRELMRQIRSCYYERYLLSNGKETPSVAKLVDDESIPSSKVLDHLSLEFLDLPNNFSEKDLRKAIIENLKYFILEIGNDFAFIGEEHRLTIGGEEYYIDLLFYNRTHSCLVAFELKLGEFIPEYVSKMNFYLEALDRYERNENEHPSVGIILCAKKNDVIVELSTARANSPTFISTYSTKLIDVEILKKKVLEYKEFFEANKVKK